MTETGRDVVERLRERVALCEGSIHPASAWYREDIPALLAVVEAAQEHVEIGCDYCHPENFAEHVRRADANQARLTGALAALHSQASDEGSTE